MAAQSLPGPNEYVLAAQKRVCTGPHLSRPLEDPEEVLRVIAASASGDLPREQTVSDAQIGALFGAMCVRRTFSADTNWSAGETEAFAHLAPSLERHAYLLDGDTGIDSVDTVLSGGHLTRAATRDLLTRISAGDVATEIAAAFLIGQRMNVESDDELLGYVDLCGPQQPPQLSVDGVIHLGEPYDGMKRYFRPTLFVAATCAAMGHNVVLHGVDTMPPKNGVTDEQLLRILGAGCDLDMRRAAALVEDPDVGFAYINQREFAPRAFAFAELRSHIKKRPPFATAEKTAVIFRGARQTHVVAGFFHPGYDHKLLVAMNDQAVDIGVAVKGLEGSTNLALRSRADKQTFNKIRTKHGDSHVDPSDLGFSYTENHRLRGDGQQIADLGGAALLGQAGAAYDAIALNAAWLVATIETATSAAEALERAKDALDSRAAARRLDNYIARSQ